MFSYHLSEKVSLFLMCIFASAAQVSEKVSKSMGFRNKSLGRRAKSIGLGAKSWDTAPKSLGHFAGNYGIITTIITVTFESEGARGMCNGDDGARWRFRGNAFVMVKVKNFSPAYPCLKTELGS